LFFCSDEITGTTTVCFCSFPSPFSNSLEEARESTTDHIHNIHNIDVLLFGALLMFDDI
jgi:predicted small metal-binding protein